MALGSSRCSCSPPVPKVDTEFTFTVPFQDPISTSSPRTPTFGASPSRFSDPTTPLSRRAPKLQPGLERKASLSGRPKWYMLLFGPIRLAPEMETKRTRTGRANRNQSESMVDCGCFSTKLGFAGSGRKAPWRLLHSLSCGAGVDVVTHYPGRIVL